MHEPTLMPAVDNATEQQPGPGSFCEILIRLGLDPTLRGPWAVVGKTKRVQGWKLHVSSVPQEASKLLYRIIPSLAERKVSFKVARDQLTLMQLNEGSLGSTQVGKFITIYPRDNNEATHLAEMLVDLTKGYSGPVVVTDLRLGDIIYTRYGGFNPIFEQDRLGQTFRLIYSPDGSLRIDAYTVPFKPPEGVTNPFADQPSLLLDDRQLDESPLPDKSARLLGPGYLVLEVVKQHPKGAVLRALDLRSQTHVSIKILKQGRQHCLTDQYGRDIRMRLRRQEQLGQILYGSVPIPRVDPYFEVNGDGYLPLEDIAGESIEALVVRTLRNRAWSGLSTSEQRKLLSVLEKTLVVVQQLHTHGYVHRDLTASNIWITPDESVYLLDLELAHAIDDPCHAFGLGTAGFMSPDQEQRQPPSYADDIYALGCVMVLVFTGLDPRRVLFASNPHRFDQLLGLTGNLPQRLIQVIDQCLAPQALDRPLLERVRSTVRNYLDSLSAGPPIGETAPSDLGSTQEAGFRDRHEVQRLISGGQQGLLEGVICDEASGLWQSLVREDYFHSNVETAAISRAVMRSANKGVAGVVYVLARLARFGYATTSTLDRLLIAVDWLTARNPGPDGQLPGLHFGEAGVAVAIAEAIAGGLVDRDKKLDSFLLEALSGELDWPDITHGAAGQGVASLYCADRLSEPRFLDSAHRCAHYLIEHQKRDGSWEMPPGVDGMSGETLTGFAHGVSGMVYFLTEYARRFGLTKALSACHTGLEWIIDQAIPSEDGQYVEWAYSNQKNTRWKWWCHGSPGVALLFLRLYEQTQSEKYAALASKSLTVHPALPRYPNLTQCHGLSGLGEIYLEAARVLRDQEWFRRAQDIANTLFHLRHETKNGMITWLAEDANTATADLMVGSGGILHFFLRLSLFPSEIGMPLLLNPLSNYPGSSL